MTTQIAGQKRCTRCGIVKCVSEFNRNRSMRDGLQARCKPCQLAANREWASRRPGVRRAAHRRYQEKTPRLESRTSSPQQRRAHRAVERAIARGDLCRPERCPRCECVDSPIHAHHEDYDKPLDVSWLCARCHGRLHAAEERAA